MYKKIIILFFLIITNLSASEEYFLTLRNEKVNLRQGPSFEYPIKIFYKKKYLPVLIIDKSENFRKIRDHEDNTGWIHISQLSKKKSAITNVDNLFVFKKPTNFSKPLVVLEKGRLCRVLKCQNEWYKKKVNNLTGWVKKNSLWGRI